MRSWLVLIALGLVMPLAGCDAQTLMKKFTPVEESAVARRHLDDIQSGNFAPVLKQIAPENRAQFAKLLPQMKALVPDEKPKSVKIIGSRTAHNPSAVVYALTYEYEYSRIWLVAQIVLERGGKELKITGIHFTPLAESVEHFNRFTLFDKGILHYGFMLAAILILIFVISTAVVCWRTRIPKRKWLWMAFVLLGLGSFTLNWTSGEITYQVISFVLLGVGYRQELYGPWLLQIGLPIGAAAFWLRRKNWLPVESSRPPL